MGCWPHHQQSRFFLSSWFSKSIVMNKYYFSGLMKIAAETNSGHKTSSDAIWLQMTENMVYFQGTTNQSPRGFSVDEPRICHPLEKPNSMGASGQTAAEYSQGVLKHNRGSGAIESNEICGYTKKTCRENTSHLFILVESPQSFTRVLSRGFCWGAGRQ